MPGNLNSGLLMFMIISADCSSADFSGISIFSCPLNGAINGFPSGAVELTSKVVSNEVAEVIFATMQKEG